MTSPRLLIPPCANLPNPANSLKWALLGRTGARVGVQMGFMSTLPWGSDAPPCNTCRVFLHVEVHTMMFAIYGSWWDHCMYTTDLGKWVKETPRKAILSLFFFDMPAQSCSAVKFAWNLRKSKPRIWVFQGIVTKLHNKSIWGAGKQDSTGGLFGFDCISKILEVHSYKATHLVMFSGKQTMYVHLDTVHHRDIFTLLVFEVLLFRYYPSKMLKN